MIKIYQIALSEMDILLANSQGFEYSAAAHAKYRMMLGAGQWNEKYVPLYKATYEVDTDDLDKAFEITNLWNEDYKVTRLRRGSSSSVGDIFVKDGDCYIVDNFGFVNVGKYEGMN